MIISSNILAAVLTILGRDVCRRLRFPQSSLPSEPAVVYEGLGSLVLFISGIVYFLIRFVHHQAPGIRSKHKNFMYNNPIEGNLSSENRVESRIEKAKRWVNSNFQGTRALQHQARRYICNSSLKFPKKVNLRQNASRFIPKYFANRQQNWRSAPNDERYNLQMQEQPSTSGISTIKRQDSFSDDIFSQPKPCIRNSVDKLRNIVDTSNNERENFKIESANKSPVAGLDKTFCMPNKNSNLYDSKRQQWLTCARTCTEPNNRNVGLELNSDLHPKPHQSLANSAVDSTIKENFVIRGPRDWEDNKIDEAQPSTSDISDLKQLFQQKAFSTPFCSIDCNFNHNHDYMDASGRGQHLPMIKQETNGNRVGTRSSSRGNVNLLNVSHVIPNSRKHNNKKTLLRDALKKMSAKHCKRNQNIDLTTELRLSRKIGFKPKKKLLKTIKKPKEKKCPPRKRKLHEKKNAPKKKGRKK